MRKSIRYILTCAAIVISATMTYGQEKRDEPRVEYIMELRVELGEAYSVGTSTHGMRHVIPIIGGTFEGENIRGSIVAGGADYQLIDNKLHRTELEAIYSIKTDDGTYIHVRNKGITCENVDGSTYFRTAPTFEAPNDSKYAWLNNAIYLCTCRGGFEGGIILDIWRVK